MNEYEQKKRSKALERQKERQVKYVSEGSQIELSTAVT